jgi:UDP-N-acetylglucosamine 2-epimerase (non-hydrolysing)
LVGTNKKKIVSCTNTLLQDKAEYEKMSKLHNPYGDGKASNRILDFLLDK